MKDFTRGIQIGLQFAIELEKELAKSPAFFADYENWKAYKAGVEDYRDKIQELHDAPFN